MVFINYQMIDGFNNRQNNAVVVPADDPLNGWVLSDGKKKYSIPQKNLNPYDRRSPYFAAHLKRGLPYYKSRLRYPSVLKRDHSSLIYDHSNNNQ